MIRTLDDAVRAGEPLIDITVRFKNGVDYDLATQRVNALGPDIDLDRMPWYGDPCLRRGQVTAEGAFRLFGLRITRVAMNNSGGNPGDHFMWTQTRITTWPEPVAPFVESIGMTQPGANDEGQPDSPLFDR